MFKEPLRPTPTLPHVARRCGVCCAGRAVGSIPGEQVTLHWAPTSCRSGQTLSHLSPRRQAPFRNGLPLGLLWVSDAVGAPSRDGTPQRGRQMQRAGGRPFPALAGFLTTWPCSLGKSPVLTGLTVRNSILCPRPPRPYTELFITHQMSGSRSVEPIAVLLGSPPNGLFLPLKWNHGAVSGCDRLSPRPRPSTYGSLLPVAGTIVG